MSMRDTRPSLTTGNHIYLYRLLSEELGCGRQTLLPRVEEALASDRMGASDLGFESTRELLEQLDDFVKLTVFKGGRIYATVIAQPAWDEALAAPEKHQADNSGKPWKRRKADKSLKPVKPRRIKRKAADDDTPRQQAADAPALAADAGAQAGPDAPSAAPAEPDGPDTRDEPDAAARNRAEGQPAGDGLPDDVAAAEPEAEEAVAADETVDEIEADGCAANGGIEGAEREPAEGQAAQPAITLTVVYDPENANAGMRTLESTPGIANVAADEKSPDTPEQAPEQADEQEDGQADAPADAVAGSDPAGQPEAPADAPERDRPAGTEPLPERAPADAPAPAVASAAPSDPEPPLPDDAPVDFAYDVYCPADLLAKVSYLLPYGADALGIMTEYFHIARLRRTLEASRNRIAFPLGYTRDGERRTVTIRLKRSATRGGTSWVVDGLA